MADGKRWDIFISHAWEDKEPFVDALATELRSRGYRVWYDTFVLKLGDSLRMSIDRGLDESHFGIVVLSEAFFRKQWPQTELDGLIARESSGTKVILPVWHGVVEEEVRARSPLLAGRLAVSSSVGVRQVVDEVEQVAKPVADRTAETVELAFPVRSLDSQHRHAVSWVGRSRAWLRRWGPTAALAAIVLAGISAWPWLSTRIGRSEMQPPQGSGEVTAGLEEGEPVSDNMAYLTVRSPFHADELWINGVLFGATRGKPWPVAAGERLRVEVRKAGHSRFLREVGPLVTDQSVTIPSEEVAVAMTPLPGYLELRVSPAGAEVRVDGERRESSQPIAVPSGQVLAVTIGRAGYVSVERELLLEPGQRYPWRVDLEPIPPALVEPAMAVVASSAEAPPKLSGRSARKPVNPLRRPETEHRPEMLWIQPGTFTMGSPEAEAGRYKREGPQHEVTLTRGFYLSRTEVTQGQYEAVMGDNPSYLKECEDCPVESVNWYDAVAFSNRLSELEGLSKCYEKKEEGWRWLGGCSGYRLPTEAEWEYAARAGTDGATFDEAVPRVDLAWYAQNSGGSSQEVAGKRANAWGLHDMLGNVNEWCWDWFGNYVPDAQLDPKGGVKGANRVVRGGSWRFPAKVVRSAYRDRVDPSFRYGSLGFRLAQGPE